MDTTKNKKFIQTVISPFGCTEMANSCVSYLISVTIFKLSFPVTAIISM